ncbi:MAG TPA: glycosyltransferase family 4 protein [Thermoanaerobaculia bacterium]
MDDVSVVAPAAQRERAGAAERELRVLALTSYPDEAACTRFRIGQFVDRLSARGAHVTLLPFLDTAAFRRLYDPRRWLQTTLSVIAGIVRRVVQLPVMWRADVVFIQREAMLLGPPLVEWIAARVARRPVVLDLDDATYLDQAGSVYGRLTRVLKARHKAERLIDYSSLVICGNEWIADYVRARGRRAAVLPTTVDTALFTPRSDDPTTGRDVPVIGWIGSHSTAAYLKTIVPVLERLARDHRFRVRVVGAGEPIAIAGVEVDNLPWRRDREVFDFQTLDIGVYPLADDVWAQAKSGLKAAEYLAVGVPFVASPVGVVAHLGREGETHFFARTPDEWYEALARLLREPQRRQVMGAACRAYAIEHYSVEEVGRCLDELLRGAASRMRHLPT